MLRLLGVNFLAHAHPLHECSKYRKGVDQFDLYLASGLWMSQDQTLKDTMCVRPDMRYCFRSGRCRPNPRTKHISVPPRHMTKSYIPDFNMISHHYRYKDTTSHTIVIQLPEYNTSTEDTFLSTDYMQMPTSKGKTHQAHVHTGRGSLPGTSS